MSRDTGHVLVEAGAIVASEVAGATVDTVTARTYQHPALEERVVVRLVPKGLGQAEDLAMEFLGFAPSTAPVEVGVGRRQALGFPAWTLINDPDNGHHALALVKDVERLTRLARTKPGRARDGFEELGDRLGKSVPHFLPTFYEQAGRAFVAADNKQTAALMFGRARQAEQVHALTIDEDRQRDVFLEFAFCGALSAKALSQHAKDLALRTDPRQAYELFLRICLERVAGGLPPYAGMGKDLRRLARAAALNPTEQDDRLIRALLETPALARAPLAFWRDYAATITRLARADVAVQEQLLDMFPAQEQDGVEDLWFDLLGVTGAIRGLTTVEDDPAVPRPRGGAAAWLEQAVRWRGRGWRRPTRSQRMLDVVKRMVARLGREGAALDLVPANRPYSTDLDVLDLCLSAGLDVKVPKQLPHLLPLERWLYDAAPGRRNLSALCAADWAQDVLLRSLEHTLRNPTHRPGRQQLLALAQVQPLLGNAGPRQVLAQWLRRIADDVETAALPGLRAALDRLAPVAHAAVLAVEPTLRSRLRAADPGRALARTLRIGLLDEFGWPALEQALPDFPKPTDQPAWRDGLQVREAWPALVLASDAKVVAVGPTSILASHDVRRPSTYRSFANIYAYSTSAEFVDGQFLVSWRTVSGVVGYWSGSPGEVFEVPSAVAWWQGLQQAISLPLPSGGRTTGGRPLVAGARSFAERRRVVSDGTSWYRWEERGWREFDPATGNPGRFCLPTFLEAGLESDGAQLENQVSALAPVPEGCEESPLGTSGGLLGWRAVVNADGSKVGTSIDETTVHLSTDQVGRLADATPAGSLRLPDGTKVTVLFRGNLLTLWDGRAVGSQYVPGTRSHGYAAGTPYVPPLAWWHALRPRDETGSAVLRTVTDAQGQALLTAGPKAVRRVLPGVSHPGLVAGIAGAVEIATGCAQSLAALPEADAEPSEADQPAEAGNPSEAGQPADPQVSDEQLAKALSGLSSRNGKYPTTYYAHNAHNMPVTSTFRAIRSACDRLAEPARKGLLAKLTRHRGPQPVQEFPEGNVDWPCAIGGLAAIALRAASAATPEQDRAALIELLGTVSRTPLVEADGRWRVVVLKRESRAGGGLPSGASGGQVENMPGKVIDTGRTSAVVLHVAHRWNGNPQAIEVVTALEHSPSGTFGAVPGFTVGSSRRNTGWGGRERVRELLELIRSRGPAPWSADAVDRLVGLTGLTRAEASLLLAGLPRIDSTLHNFLDSGTRKVLGLKVAEAASARRVLAALPAASRLMSCGSALPERVIDLWDRGPDVDAVAQAWVAAFGRRVVVPEDLVAEADTTLKQGHLPTAALLSGLVGPSTCSWLTVDERFSVKDGQLTAQGDSGGLDGQKLVPAAAGLLWLSYRLPLDSPLRAALPRTHAALLDRLRNPDLLVPALRGHDLGGIRQAYEHPAPTPMAVAGTARTVALGAAGVLVDHGYATSLYLRPAQLSDPQDPLLKATEGVFDPPTAALRLLRDPAVARLVEGPGLPETGWAQDPAVSVPELVVQVQQDLGLDESAARLYLQVLALPDPTDQNVARWNGWTPTHLRRATHALLDAKLLVGGKRSRAGRKAFLPGGWLDVKAPMLPIETWKVSLLGFLPDGRGPLGVSVPARPVAELFPAAWDRVRSGEGPALETLQTGRRR
ncbi:MAG: hypothetical protein QG608_3554 [Actinomycetota bacterium]|nr:hypothetical protein [Actinomycetota bacterium]